MIKIKVVSGTRTKFYNPEYVITFDYDKDTLYKIKGIAGAKYNKRTKSWHLPEKMGTTIISTFPDAIVSDTIKKQFPNKQFNDIDFPKEITLGWGADSYKMPTVYKKSSNKELKIVAKPYPYQKEGIKFMVQRQNSILADDMGLGKTLQSLTASILLKSKKTLIICPNTAKYNWASEIEKFIPSASYIVIDGSKQDRQKILHSKYPFMFYILNYDAVMALNDDIISLNPDMIIYDEAHRMKNRKTKRTRAAKKISAKYKILLTGTPLMNRVEELWSLLKIIEPNKWPGYDAFVKRYCEKGGYQNREIVGYQNLDELKEKMSKIMLRRRKDEVLKQLPEKIYQDCYLDLDTKTMSIYKQAEYQTYLELTQNQHITINGIFGKIIRLKQIAVAPEILGATHKSTKIEECEKITEEIIASGNKVVIYSQFKKVTDYLVEMFSKKYKIAYINGDVSSMERKNQIDLFQNDPQTPIFIGTIQSCKEAINLTAASYIIFMDKLWNPQDNRQAEDRCHRHGQEKNVNIISLIAKNTIEEKIEKKLSDKQDLFNTVIEKDGGAKIAKKTPNDIIKELFSEE